MNWIDNALGIHPRTLTLLSQRSGVLAANIANAGTPDFKARDIDFRDVLKAEQMNQKVSLVKTSANHLGPGRDALNNDLLYRVPTKDMVNGNSVEAEVEQAAFADNALRYQTSLTFLSGTISGLKMAIKGGR